MADVVETAEIPEIVPTRLLNDQQRIALLRWMLYARIFDEVTIRLYRQGKMFGSVFAQIGHEAISVGSAAALQPEDAIFPMHRDLGAHFVRGVPLRTIALNHLARQGSMMRGTDGTGHYADPQRKLYGNISHLGAMIPVAVGYALAAQLKGEPIVVLNYIGEGGAQTGEFHEGLNFAAVRKAPFVLIIENNQYAYSTPTNEEYACEKLSDRAIGYGIFGETIDGTDVERVYEATFHAVERARRGEGPSLIEAICMRMRGHAEHDNASYVPRELLEYWKKRDPLLRYQRFLVENGILAEADIQRMRQEIEAETVRVLDEVLQLPFPPAEEAFKNVFL